MLLFNNFDQIYANYQTKGETTHIHDHEALIQFTQLGMGISMIAKSLIPKFNIQYMDIPEQYRYCLYLSY
jgi:DNA-binding transcriptional LysR family regulator